MVTIEVDYKDSKEKTFSFASSSEAYHKKLDELEKQTNIIENIAIYKGISSTKEHPLVFAQMGRELITKSTHAGLVIRRARKLKF